MYTHQSIGTLYYTLREGANFPGFCTRVGRSVINLSTLTFRDEGVNTIVFVTGR